MVIVPVMVLLPFLRCAALTYSTPEYSCASAIAFFVEMYQTQHNGALPKDWHDLEELMNCPIAEFMPYAAPSKRYAIFSPPLRVSALVSGELLAMNRSAIHDSTLSQGLLGLSHGTKGPGRYVIYRDAKGHFSWNWFTESQVAVAFATAGVVLPVPDTEPERVWVIKARRSMYIGRAFYALIVACGAWLVWRRISRPIPWVG